MEDSAAEETKSHDQVSLSGTSLANTETTAGARRKGKEPEAAPYLYTTKFNRDQDLLFCGGAGKNEMRVFDWRTGGLVANIGNLPKAITSGAQANSSSMFCFGSVDSRTRIFSMENRATTSQRSFANSSQLSSGLSMK